MNCLKCGKQLNTLGICDCGFNIFSEPVLLTSPLNESQMTTLTGYCVAQASSGNDAMSYFKGNGYPYWGPRRQTYTMTEPAQHAVFNSITDNAAVGDERAFVRIVERGTNNVYRFDVDIEPNKQYIVYIYYHNNASATFNDKQHGYVGAAKEVRVATSFPHSLKKGERGLVRAKISSSNTDPREVYAGAYLTAKEDVTLHYIMGSPKIFNAWNRAGTMLSAKRLFSPEGTYIGLQELNGIILGCDEFSGSVTYILTTESAQTSSESDSEPHNRRKGREALLARKYPHLMRTRKRVGR